jgi:hypothetical protein
MVWIKMLGKYETFAKLIFSNINTDRCCTLATISTVITVLKT